MSELSHLNEKGEAQIVDVGDKALTRRVAVATATIAMKAATRELIVANRIAKGDVFAVARIAGIMAAKETSRLIPMCHPLRLDSVAIDFELIDKDVVKIVATAKATDRTGVEMEALTAASVAALTIYDMCKSSDRAMIIRETKLVEKTGGKSGDWRCE
jgi:cyclic pyranopterin monophosphate synthase